LINVEGGAIVRKNFESCGEVFDIGHSDVMKISYFLNLKIIDYYLEFDF